MKVIRVFPRQTSLTPRDDYAFVGDPPMMRPEADEVHVSCTFTWDIDKAQRLVSAWGQYYPVKLGGPAIEYTTADFMPGKYIAPGITFTSRGCNNHCPWCLVRHALVLDVLTPGWVVQDDNLLQCGRLRVERVFEMLRYQGRPITFSGGIDSRLVSDWFVDELRTVPIDQIFLACDTKEAIKPLRKAVAMIGLPRDKTRCYVLLKFKESETITEATARLEDVWNAGAMPFAQLYQPPDHWIDYPREWQKLARTWSRPAATKKLMQGGAE